MTEKVTVGFIRPIDPKDGFSKGHFSFLEDQLAKELEKQSNDEFKFISTGLVSESAGVADINRTLIQNVFHSDMIIAIMSDLNANVMFEIGLRLSQKKPTILVCDDETQLPFDTSSFYTVKYPKALPADMMDKFLNEFNQKFLGTWTQFKNDNGQSTFIAPYADETIIDTSVSKLSLNEAVDKLGHMLDLMQRKYIALDPDDVWDDFNFEHDVSAPISLRTHRN